MAISRRKLLKSAAAAVAWSGLSRSARATSPEPRPLSEFGYGDVALGEGLARQQLEQTHAIVMGMSDDSLLKPFRVMAGMAAPGEELGGWYEYKADFDYHIKQKAGLCPGANYGQWVSALGRYHAITGDQAARAKVLGLTPKYASAISEKFYEKSRFPAYTYDKIVCGLMDAHRLVGDGEAFKALDATTQASHSQMPGRAVERFVEWREGRDDSFTWDESFTLPENLFLVSKMMSGMLSRLGDGRKYRAMAEAYLDDWAFFDPLARGEEAMYNRHAYSAVNALSSAMQAYLTLGSVKHLDAAKNGFDQLEAQSFATGGWGADEWLEKPNGSFVFDSLKKTHQSFETPCGAYAHMKLTRYLLRSTRDGRYGDSMERVIQNTVLGALPLKADGSAFYYADYNEAGKRTYSEHIWPCCSGTLPQVAADYGISTYLREPGAVWVNLYWPSTLRWREGFGSRMTLTQTGTYPLGDAVEIRIGAERKERFTLRLRVPAWCAAAEIRVNGKAWPIKVVKGFASISREWREDDRVELRLPGKLRLVPIDAAHQDVVALMQGPLVLFAKESSSELRVTREQLLAAAQVGSERVVNTDAGELRLVPFPELGDAQYATYLEVS
jgi:hypothetical protein